MGNTHFNFLTEMPVLEYRYPVYDFPEDDGLSNISKRRANKYFNPKCLLIIILSILFTFYRIPTLVCVSNEFYQTLVPLTKV